MFSATMPPRAAIEESERALAVWETYARSERAPSGTMSALALEGFLTALVTCPTTLPMNIWFLRVWGDAAPKFASDAERDAITAAVIAVKHGIVARLALGGDHYRPACLPALGRAELDNVREWVAGFWKIVELSPDWLIRLLEDRGQRKVITPFVGFVPESGARCMEETDDNRERLHLHANALGVAVLVLDRMKKKREKSAAVQPGRNAQCPCGSGRKYKRCCA